MSAGLEFLDTNVLVYAFTTDVRAERAQEVLQRGCVLSIQSLNEFVNVASRKLAFTWAELDAALSAIRSIAVKIESLRLETHEAALRLARRHRLSVFDAMILAAALQAGCETLWSEDMQHGLLVDDRMAVRNPFHAAM